jgi:hypothetical protein
VTAGWLTVVTAADCRSAEAGLLRNTRLEALATAAYAATWSADDGVVVAHVEVELVATAVVVSKVRKQD